MVLRVRQKFSSGTIPASTLGWPAKRDFISLLDVVEKPPLLAATYAVVVFTILIQSLRLHTVVKRATSSPHGEIA
jgi:monovalent cation:H+ antiporter, CPA1 family